MDCVSCKVRLTVGIPRYRVWKRLVLPFSAGVVHSKNRSKTRDFFEASCLDRRNVSKNSRTRVPEFCGAMRNVWCCKQYDGITQKNEPLASHTKHTHARINTNALAIMLSDREMSSVAFATPRTCRTRRNVLRLLACARATHVICHEHVGQSLVSLRK